MRSRAKEARRSRPSGLACREDPRHSDRGILDACQKGGRILFESVADIIACRKSDNKLLAQWLVR